MASASSKRSTNRLEGKVAIATAAVTPFHANGVLVVIPGIQDDLGCAVEAKLGGRVEYIRCDVTDEGEVSFLGAKHAARVMLPQRKGCILFTGSTCIVISGISTNTYAASKYGMLGLARNLAAELGEYGIRINCVAPYAFIGTGIVSQFMEPKNMDCSAINLRGPTLIPEDVAHAALYLTSDEAGHANGVNLVLDGGLPFMSNSS